MADTSVSETIVTPAIFIEGTEFIGLGGSWTADYSSTGSMSSVTGSFVVTVGGTVDTFTGGTVSSVWDTQGPNQNGLAYDPSTGNTIYEALFTDAAGDKLYIDWETQNPTTLFTGDTANPGEYTSLTFAGGSPIPVTIDATLTPCFVTGTAVATPNGSVAIETLKAGDMVTLSDGGAAPVRWIGRKAVATRFADAARAMPIRVKAGALDEALPARDLLVSPCHALHVDGLLIQAGALVNGVSILRETAMPETFTYYHVELDSHALILTEGVAAETFVDNTDRMGFDNWAEHQELFGEGVVMVEMTTPRAKSIRQVPAAIRARLSARAVQAHAIAA
jgi:hypothetical protein